MEDCRRQGATENNAQPMSPEAFADLYSVNLLRTKAYLRSRGCFTSLLDDVAQ
jgi:hypothetical protein